MVLDQVLEGISIAKYRVPSNTTLPYSASSNLKPIAYTAPAEIVLHVNPSPQDQASTAAKWMCTNLSVATLRRETEEEEEGRKNESLLGFPSCC